MMALLSPQSCSIQGQIPGLQLAILPQAGALFRWSRLPCGNVLAAGGADDEVAIATAELFNSITHIWSGAGVLGTGRGFAQMVCLLDGNAFLVGGVDSDGNVMASAELFNLSTSVWSPATEMASARDCFQLTKLLNGNLLAASGVDRRVTLPSEELYNVRNACWSAVGRLQTAKRDFSGSVPLVWEGFDSRWRRYPQLRVDVCSPVRPHG